MKSRILVPPSLYLSLAGLMFAQELFAAGLLPERDTSVVIEGRFSDPNPGFLLVFSATPLKDAQGRLLATAPKDSITRWPAAKHQLAIKVYGKPATAPGRWEYHFGELKDADQPWNNGKEFDWHNWEKYSADVGDNLCIFALPGVSSNGTILNVAIRRNGQLLFDSKAVASYPNKLPIRAALPPFNTGPQGWMMPALNLAEHAARFRDAYYELKGNPILTTAYADLGQTDKNKYALRGRNWCSEFCSYVYRENKIKTPDPNTADVHWKNLREYFERHGAVYPARAVVAWNNEKKIALIKPGSLVSIIVGDGSTHSIIFNGWITAGGGPITRYAGISGNNKSMVWSHAPLSLPVAADLEGKSKAELENYDQKVFFAVPR